MLLGETIACVLLRLLAFNVLHVSCIIRMEKKCRGERDKVLMRGTLLLQTIELENGETTCINHFFVTSLEVESRSKRTSNTAFEREKTR